MPKEVWYSVTTFIFDSVEAKERYLRTGGAQLRIHTSYYGLTERWASVRFVRACAQMHKDPLVQGVQFRRDGKLVAWVSVGVPPAWNSQDEFE